MNRRCARTNCSLLTNCKGYYCGHLGLSSGQPLDTPRASVGHVPVVYSLHDPRGLTSSRIRLSRQSILFQSCPYSPLSTNSPKGSGSLWSQALVVTKCFENKISSCFISYILTIIVIPCINCILNIIDSLSNYILSYVYYRPISIYNIKGEDTAL